LKPKIKVISEDKFQRLMTTEFKSALSVFDIAFLAKSYCLKNDDEILYEELIYELD